jgi:hypothetical protein
MYLALTLLSMLAFLPLCLVGLFTLIKQAIADPRFSPPHVFIEADPLPAAAAPSEDPEGCARGQGCA